MAENAPHHATRTFPRRAGPDNRLRAYRLEYGRIPSHTSPSSRVILRVPESYQHACVIMTRSRVYMAHDRIETADSGHHGPEPCQYALHVDTVRSHVSTRGVSTGTPTLIDPQNRDSTTKTITHGFCAIAKVERVRDSMSLVATLCMLLVVTCIRTLVSMSMSKGD